MASQFGIGEDERPRNVPEGFRQVSLADNPDVMNLEMQFMSELDGMRRGQQLLSSDGEDDADDEASTIDALRVTRHTGQTHDVASATVEDEEQVRRWQEGVPVVFRQFLSKSALVDELIDVVGAVSDELRRGARPAGAVSDELRRGARPAGTGAGARVWVDARDMHDPGRENQTLIEAMTEEVRGHGQRRVYTVEDVRTLMSRESLVGWRPLFALLDAGMPGELMLVCRLNGRQIVVKRLPAPGAHEELQEAMIVGGNN